MKREAIDQRIGELCRNGRPIYYAILGQAMIESADRAEIVAALHRYEHKMAQWDRNRR